MGRGYGQGHFSPLVVTTSIHRIELLLQFGGFLLNGFRVGFRGNLMLYHLCFEGISTCDVFFHFFGKQIDRIIQSRMMTANAVDDAN